jgi:hypothetical protein
MADERTYEVGLTIVPLLKGNTMIYGCIFSENTELWNSNSLFNVKE